MNDYEQQMLAEMKKMNTNLEKLITYAHAHNMAIYNPAPIGSWGNPNGRGFETEKPYEVVKPFSFGERQPSFREEPARNNFEAQPSVSGSSFGAQQPNFGAQVPNLDKLLNAGLGGQPLVSGFSFYGPKTHETTNPFVENQQFKK